MRTSAAPVLTAIAFSALVLVGVAWSRNGTITVGVGPYEREV